MRLKYHGRRINFVPLTTPLSNMMPVSQISFDNLPFQKLRVKVEHDISVCKKIGKNMSMAIK
jgi:hypothetical protein